MKNATLAGLVGSVIILLIQVFYFVRSLSTFSVIEDSTYIRYVISYFLGIAAWCCIAYFFITFYRKQK